MALKKGRLALTSPTGFASSVILLLNKVKAKSLSRNLDDVLDKGPHFWYVNVQSNHSAFSFLGFLRQSKSKRECAFFYPKPNLHKKYYTTNASELFLGKIDEYFRG